MHTETKRGEQAVLFGVLKWLCAAALLVFLVSQLSQGKISSMPFESVWNAVTAPADTSLMQEADEQMIRRLYGLDPAQYEGIALYYPTTNMGAEEILLVKLADTAQQAAVTAAIDARLATQMASFDGYGIEQYAMLEASLIDPQGNYILFVSAADPAPIRDAFRAAL